MQKPGLYRATKMAKEDLYWKSKCKDPLKKQPFKQGSKCIFSFQEQYRTLSATK